MNQVGFDDESVAYWNLFSFPAALMLRSAQKMFPAKHTSEFPRVPGLINKLLIFCADVERLVFRKCPLYYGLSIMGVFRKK